MPGKSAGQMSDVFAIGFDLLGCEDNLLGIEGKCLREERSDAAISVVTS